jgi:hypothetical protein
MRNASRPDPDEGPPSEPAPDVPALGDDRRHPAHVGHMHVHDPDCGHPTVPHETHVDYVHDEHRHAGHDTHYDEH